MFLTQPLLNNIVRLGVALLTMVGGTVNPGYNDFRIPLDLTVIR